VVLAELEERRVGSTLGHRSSSVEEFGLAPIHPPLIIFSYPSPHLVDDGLSILQYADDMILFIEHNFDQANNMKQLLSAFEYLSDLKINFHKSEIFYFGKPMIRNRSMNNYLDIKTTIPF
jgi:hypothetical protein